MPLICPLKFPKSTQSQYYSYTHGIIADLQVSEIEGRMVAFPVSRYILSPRFFIRPDRIFYPPGLFFLGYFIRGQDILSPKASSYMRLQPSCPVGCIALYPTAIDFWKSKDAWHCAIYKLDAESRELRDLESRGSDVASRA